MGCRHHQDTQAVRQSLTAHGYLGACRAILARDIGCIAERPAAGLDASRALLDAHEAELPALQRIRYVAAGWMTNVARFSRSHIAAIRFALSLSLSLCRADMALGHRGAVPGLLVDSRGATAVGSRSNRSLDFNTSHGAVSCF